MYDKDREVPYSQLKDGLSGIMRVKNEARFVANSIDSCIEALDELVIVYNDCTDESPEIIERKRQQYPDKIKVYAYNHNVLAFNLTDEDFEYAVSLPEDSPRLHCSECNYALSKVTYKYALKIDPDQVYFADELKKWRDVCSRTVKVNWKARCVVGWIFMMCITLYRRMSMKFGKPCLWVIPDWLVNSVAKSYIYFSMWQLQRGKACICISGANVFYDDRWYITFDGVNVHPPYNGAGDHLIFPVSAETYFRRMVYSFNRTVVEWFNCPKKMMIAGPMWFHLHANRERCWSSVKRMKDEHPECFVPIEDFSKMTYRQVLNKMDKIAHTLFQMTLFALVHKMGKNLVLKYIKLLNK